MPNLREIPLIFLSFRVNYKSIIRKFGTEKSLEGEKKLGKQREVFMAEVSDE